MGGGLAVADVIEAVIELLAGDGGAVRPRSVCRDNLAEGVVLVNPVGGFGVDGTGTLRGEVYYFRNFNAFVPMVIAERFGPNVKLRTDPFTLPR